MGHNNLYRLAIPVVLFIMAGCFESKKVNDGEGDKTDIRTLLASPDEGAEIMAEIICGYYERCPYSSVICSEGNSEVHCRVEEIPFKGDACLQLFSQTFAEAFKCAALTDEIERRANQCLKALRSAECIDVTDENLREYEKSIERGEDKAPGGVPESCIGLEDFFTCGDDESDEDIEVNPMSNRCIPGESRTCVCPNGATGIKTCSADGMGFSTCNCPSDISVSAAPAGSGADTAGAGGGVPEATRIVNQTISCVCGDGTVGVAVCLDGTGYSECQCVRNEGDGPA
jgi:hypothetical protein